MEMEDFITVSIIVDGHEAVEYPAESQIDEKNSEEIPTRYIEVVSEAQFWFRFTLSPNYRFEDGECLTLRTFIDGNYAGGVPLFQVQQEPGLSTIAVVDGQSTGTGSATQKLIYYFADLKTRRVCCSSICTC